MCAIGTLRSHWRYVGAAVLLAGVAGSGRYAEARSADGTLKLLRVPISTHPVIVTPGGRFTMHLQNSIDINGVSVELIDGDKVIPIYTSDPHDVFKVQDRRTFDLPSWECLVDGWKMSWMWRPRVTVHDLVTVPVPVPDSVPEGLYGLRVRCSAGQDTSQRAVCVVRQFPTNYKIAHVTDAHVDRGNPDRLKTLLGLAQMINRLKPAFVLCTGDNTNDNYPEEYEAFLKFIDALAVPAFVLGGNHDTGGKVYEGHADELLYIGDPYYSFDFGDDHYTGVDNSTRLFDSEQVEWIKADLAAARGKAMRTIFGHSLYQQSKKDHAWFDEQLWGQYDVGLYLFGHVHSHHKEAKNRGQTTWISTAPACDGHFSMVTIADHGLFDVERLHFDPNAPPTAPAAPAAPATAPSSQAVDQWTPLFDGKTLAGWRVLEEGAFVGHREVRVEGGSIILERGQMQTGVSYSGEFPRDNYEVSLEAKRTVGHDFFCGMTFPVGDEPCTLIVGGWGGAVVGLSNVDNQNASENLTTTGVTFEDNRWYRIRLRVTPERIEAWVDDAAVINLARNGHTFDVWWEQKPARPFGIATWDTGAALRDIKLRRLR